MGFLHQLQLLLWKNISLKRRGPVSPAASCEDRRRRGGLGSGLQSPQRDGHAGRIRARRICGGLTGCCVGEALTGRTGLTAVNMNLMMMMMMMISERLKTSLPRDPPPFPEGVLSCLKAQTGLGRVWDAPDVHRPSLRPPLRPCCQTDLRRERPLFWGLGQMWLQAPPTSWAE